MAGGFISQRANNVDSISMLWIIILNEDYTKWSIAWYWIWLESCICISTDNSFPSDLHCVSCDIHSRLWASYQSPVWVVVQVIYGSLACLANHRNDSDGCCFMGARPDCLTQNSLPYCKHINGLVQDCSISSALAMEILQSYTKPLICTTSRSE